MYTQLLTLVRAIAAWPALRPVLAEPTGPPTAAGQSAPSVLTALESVRKQVFKDGSHHHHSLDIAHMPICCPIRSNCVCTFSPAIVWP